MITLVSLSVAPHFLNLKLWVVGFFVGILVLRYVSLKRNIQKLPGLLLFLLTLSGLATVLTSYPYLTNQYAGVALLSIMLGLKVLELGTKRDHFVAIFGCLFALVTQFLFDQSMLMAGYVLLVLIGLISQQLSISRHRPAPFSLAHFKFTLSLFTQAIPVAIVLFIFFPRFIGPLWSLGLDSASGVTGLSDSITPGSISNLIQSKAVAFRVEFKKESPPNRSLYWRGPVLWETDGYRWTRGYKSTSSPGKTVPTYKSSGTAVDYQVTVEPSNNKWLYALDLPSSVPRNSQVSFDFQILTSKPLEKRFRYSMRSHLNYNTGHLTNEEKQHALQLPDNITERMRQLVEGWELESEQPVDLVNRALQYFRKQPFYYTLRPPKLIDNPVDEFLFESRQGFCEHYATSFVTLMRLAGIPARIVTGYQGGELNPLGGYLIVRQSDAHAWSEVWLADKGWVKADPTAMVAPERVEQHFDFQLNSSILGGDPITFTIRKGDLFDMTLKQFSLAYDMFNTSWNQWILGYSNERQNRMMDLLGLDFLKGHYLGVGMVVGIILIMTITIIFIVRKSKIEVDTIQRYYLRFCSKLAAKGIVRDGHEGPADYAKRVAKEHPEWSQAIRPITANYIALRYREVWSKNKLNQFIRQVKNFRP